MIRQICTIDMPYINDDIPYMYEDKPYMYEDKPYMHDDKPHMYDDMTDIKDDMTDINDDKTDMYEYHIHVWYHVAWGGSIKIERIHPKETQIPIVPGVHRDLAVSLPKISLIDMSSLAYAHHHLTDLLHGSIMQIDQFA